MNRTIQIESFEWPRGKTPPCMRFVCRSFLATCPERPLLAVIDTGAPFSIIPRALWKDGTSRIEFAPEARDWEIIHGIGGGSESCEFGRLHVMLADERTSLSGWLRIPAQLAKTDAVPLVLGVAGFLDTYRLTLNEDGSSYVVVPGL